MQRLGPQLLLSATDLVNFHECAHLTALDLAALDDKVLKATKTKPDEHTELLFKRFSRPTRPTPSSRSRRCPAPCRSA